MLIEKFPIQHNQLTNSGMMMVPDMAICQQDYPLDWYQAEFQPYAEEYRALPNRNLSTIIPWMESYIIPAVQHFGDNLLLLAHYYMGGEIVKLVEHFGGLIGDSYQLALMAYNNPEKKVIVESAVHFMAESISILANENQTVYITNPKSGCTMEQLAKDYMVEPAFEDLCERYGQNSVLPICYMNTSARVKAMCGALGGVVCTSSNVLKLFKWALTQNKKILFIPDQHMGENVAGWVGIPKEKIAYWPAGHQGANFNLFAQSEKVLQHFDQAQLVLFASHCSVHSYFQPEMIHYWQSQGFCTIAHPECRKAVVDIADHWGSTAFIWDYVMHDRMGTKKYAIATENHMVQNLKLAACERNIEVVNVGDAKLATMTGRGCGCATMSRNDPPHLVAVLDLLRKGYDLSANVVKPGDQVNSLTGTRERLNSAGQGWIAVNAKKALMKMIEISNDNGGHYV